MDKNAPLIVIVFLSVNASLAENIAQNKGNMFPQLILYHTNMTPDCFMLPTVQVAGCSGSVKCVANCRLEKYQYLKA